MDGWELGVKSFGGIIWYLQHCLLVHDILSMKSFELYNPIDTFVEKMDGIEPAYPKNMV